MSDFFVDHTQFIAVPTDERQQQQQQEQQQQRQWLDGRTIILMAFILVPVIVCCGIYMLILGTNQRLLYPKCCNIEVPSLWIYRATIYNNYNNESVITTNTDDDRKLQLFNDDDDDNNDINDEFKLVCYYNFPNIDDFRVLLPNQIDPYLCTHINIGFATIKNNQIYLNNQQLQIMLDLIKLKEINVNLKILLSIGGAGNDNGFSDMVINHINRKLFIHSIIEYVKLYKIDGIDLDWEFPNRIPNNHDKQQRLHFTQLLEECRIAINKQQKHKFLLSVAVGAPDFIVDLSYDVPYINQFVDYVNLMSYDYHFYTKLTPFTGHNSPLYQSINDNGIFKNFNINHTVINWLLKGLNHKKLIIGLSTYGHSYRLINLQNNGLYAPSKNYGKLGTNGFVDYGQICKFLDINQIKPIFDLDSKCPYATKSLEWVSFDNEQSLSFKAEYIRDHHFGGAMIYSLNTDDHKGVCRIDRHIPIVNFPLTRKVHEILNVNYSLF